MRTYPVNFTASSDKMQYRISKDLPKNKANRFYLYQTSKVLDDLKLPSISHKDGIDVIFEDVKYQKHTMQSFFKQLKQLGIEFKKLI